MNRLHALHVTRLALGLAALVAWLPGHGLAQTPGDPLPRHIDTQRGLVVAEVAEFATLPDHPQGAARMMLLVDEPGTGRLFVNDMWGPLYTVSYDGRTVTEYVDIHNPRWGVGVEAGGRERGFQSFAMHPDFGRADAPGYGRFYTWSDTPDNTPQADFRPGGGTNTHHTVLLEWRANDPASATYDGGAPRELMRFEQPFGNHNAGHLAFNPLSRPGNPDFGMLYVGSADGGSGGDPLDLSQNMASAFGKILRIDPLGSTSTNGEYGIPADNPHVGEAGVLGEIWASGMRNPQRFAWDPVNGNLFMADIGQNLVEKVSLVPRGGNLGWNDWEGSFRYIDRTAVRLEDPRSDPAITYPVVEYGRTDPLMGNRVAVTGMHVFRGGSLPSLRGRALFADFPSGELLHFDADDLPKGGTEGIARMLLRHGGETHTLLELIQAKNVEQGKVRAERADVRFGTGPGDRFFLLNKHDGTIREVVPGR